MGRIGRRAVRASALAVLLAMGPAMAQGTTGSEAGSIDITLTPVAEGGSVQRVEVRQLLSHSPLRWVFSMDLAQPGLPHLADSVEGILLEDAAGPIALETTDEKDAHGDRRLWRAARVATGSARLTYAVRAQPVSQNGGPPYGMMPVGTGVAGGTEGVLVLPVDTTPLHTTLRLDTGRLPSGSIGVFSTGFSPVTVEGAPAKARDLWLLAGPATSSGGSTNAGFHVHILGTPPLPKTRLMTWSTLAYTAIAKAFGYLGLPDYQLLMRAVDGPSFATGTALPGGALLTMGRSYVANQDDAYLQDTIFHEMTHQWTGEVAGESPWFSEGLTTYVASTLPCEAGLLPWADCASEINDWARQYYPNPARTWPQAKIDSVAFKDESVRRISYSRGVMYFAELDAAIRRKSHGRRTLLNALRPLFEARQGGVPIDVDRFESMLAHELGTAAVSGFRSAVITGSRTVVPPPDAFAGGLKRIGVTYSSATTASPVRGAAWVVR